MSPPKPPHGAGAAPSDLYQRFFSVIRKIPRGKVATYGQVAALAERPRHARHVGYALHGLPANSTVPWQRVVNARGEISLRARPEDGLEQRFLLEMEGVEFDVRGRIDLRIWGWDGKSRK